MTANSLVYGACRRPHSRGKPRLDRWRRLDPSLPPSPPSRTRPHLAVGTFLVAVGVTALLSSLKYFREGHVNVTVALIIATTGFIGVHALAASRTRGFPETSQS